MSEYLKIWEENTNKTFDAINEGNLKAANAYKRAADRAYNSYIEEQNELSEQIEICRNFSMANRLFEQELPRLFTENPEAVGKVINTIREDKNLSSQFRFLQALRNYDGDGDSRQYVAESLMLASEGIDKSTIKESNNKIAKIFMGLGIADRGALTEDEEKMYCDCDFLLTSERRLKNLNEINNAITSVSRYVNTHKKEDKGLVDVDELVNEYNKKYGRLLNEAEQELVKVISDARAPHAQRMQQKLFDKFKNECVELVDKLIPESNADEREKLDGLKTRLSEMAFNQGTLVKDIANLLGIRDVLMDA